LKLLEGKAVLVTGAGGGIGRDFALAMADAGASVLVNDIGTSVKGEGRDAGPAHKVADEIRARGGSAAANTDSVAEWESANRIVNGALEAFGRLDVVVNNAGILRDKAFHNLTPELLDPVLDVHLKGAFHVTRPAWARMREAGYGRVLLTASNAGILGNFGQANYGAAKMGLVGLARVLAQEGARYGIKANVLAPIARTRMTEELLGPLAPKLDPRLVAPVAAWLVHEGCPVSGEIYSVGGGRVARFFVGLTEGYANPELTLEDVRDNFDLVRDEAGYTVPVGVADEIGLLAQRLA
jgi:NAD(P)-dependent dehydrogenase (short-subunit alcohol dehydrogenase family)